MVDDMTSQPNPPLRLAVLISGGGRTLVNLAQAIAAGRLNAKVAIVVSSRAEVKGVQRAGDLGLPVHTAPRKQYENVQAFSDAVFDHIRQADAELVCLAGFLSLLAIPHDYTGRVVNIHPALLPKFGGPGMFGRHVHEAVLKEGEARSGCTVHFADDQYDTGPIIVQHDCEVKSDDTPDALAQRVFDKECEAYPQAIELLSQGRVLVVDQAVRLAPPHEGDLVQRAKNYAQAAHQDRRRDDGQLDVNPHQAVAELLIAHGVNDPAVLAAAYLHDVCERTEISDFQLHRAFGSRIAKLVDELTSPRSLQPTEKTTAILESAKTLSSDARLIKLADRLHNLTQMRRWPRDKQADCVRDTQALLEALKPWPNAALAEQIVLALAEPMDHAC